MTVFLLFSYFHIAFVSGPLDGHNEGPIKADEAQLGDLQHTKEKEEAQTENTRKQ